jgi:hypothetical protein
MALRYNIKNNIDTKTYIYFKPTESNDLDDIKLLLENLENDDKIVVYPNNEDVNQYNSYKNVKNYIYRKIEIGFLCKGLNPDYILKSFDNVDAVVIIGSSINILPNGNIYGFALINFNQESNSIYIDVICSRTGIEGAGGILINKIEDISRKLFIDSILLTSVDSAIPFYEYYGFTKFESLCDDMCVMIKHINKKFGGKRKTNKQRKTIKFKKTKKNRRLK